MKSHIDKLRFAEDVRRVLEGQTAILKTPELAEALQALGWDEGKSPDLKKSLYSLAKEGFPYATHDGAEYVSQGRHYRYWRWHPSQSRETGWNLPLDPLAKAKALLEAAGYLVTPIAHAKQEPEGLTLEERKAAWFRAQIEDAQR